MKLVQFGFEPKSELDLFFLVPSALAYFVLQTLAPGLFVCVLNFQISEDLLEVSEFGR